MAFMCFSNIKIKAFIKRVWNKLNKLQYFMSEICLQLVLCFNWKNFQILRQKRTEQKTYFPLIISKRKFWWFFSFLKQKEKLELYSYFRWSHQCHFFLNTVNIYRIGLIPKEINSVVSLPLHFCVLFNQSHFHLLYHFSIHKNMHSIYS